MDSLTIIQESDCWFEEGLKFKCTGCGKCCTGSPGYVWLTDEDITRLAKHLKLTEKEFIKRYTRTVNRRISLVEMKKTYDCVFLKNGRECSVYKARPSQCRTYPYWINNVASKEQWERESSRCEGINHPDAPVIPKEEVLQRLSEFLEVKPS